jgi:hypothetical protein
MRKQHALGAQPRPTLQHANAEEYAAFVQAYTPRKPFGEGNEDYVIVIQG